MKVKSDKVKRRGKPSDPEPDEQAHEPDEAAHSRHVADLVKRGVVKLGKPGPPLDEILKPGPAAPNALKALRWARKG